jgi:hypothetical protein
MVMDVNKTMDLTQAMQTLRWLDEERRKDKATIATLQERLQEQSQQLGQQAAQIKDLQTSIAGFEAFLSRISEFEQMVENYKAETVLLMDQREDARRKEQAESERLRRIEYEALSNHLHRMERDLQVLPRYDEEISARKAEEQRLSEAVQRLSEQVKVVSKRSEDRVQTVAYLEEQRRADNRRIGELESETTEVRQKVETLVKRSMLLEDTFQKQRAHIEDAVQATKKYEKPIEELRVADFQREQKMRQYLDQGERVAGELERLRSQTGGFLEQQQAVKRELDRLEPFRERIETRQNEIAQRQRLAEEQIKRQWEEWEIAQQKRRKKEEVLTEERWRQQAQTNEDVSEQLSSRIYPVLRLHQQQLDVLWELRRNDATVMLKSAQDVYDSLIAPVDEQLEILRSETGNGHNTE